MHEQLYSQPPLLPFPPPSFLPPSLPPLPTCVDGKSETLFPPAPPSSPSSPSPATSTTPSTSNQKEDDGNTWWPSSSSLLREGVRAGKLERRKEGRV